MKDKKTAAVGFRPYQKNRDRLDKAQALGFEISEILNTLIEENFDSHLEKLAKARIQQLQKSLATR